MNKKTGIGAGLRDQNGLFPVAVEQRRFSPHLQVHPKKRAGSFSFPIVAIIRTSASACQFQKTVHPQVLMRMAMNSA
jgi:hypothetical protein